MSKRFIMLMVDGLATSELRYQIAFNLSTTGHATSVLPNYVTLSPMGCDLQGAGVALADLNNDGKQEAFFMVYDNPAGGNSFKYVRATLNKNGIVESQSTTSATYPGLGDEGQGAGIAIADIDRDGTKDLLFMTNDNPAGGNIFKYFVGSSIIRNRFQNLWIPSFFN